jgi:hypothetical protein
MHRSASFSVGRLKSESFTVNGLTPLNLQTVEYNPSRALPPHACNTCSLELNGSYLTSPFENRFNHLSI